ncbi:flagellar hook assembly protein FlgD [Noviherbaspirillum aridicola]|uniref:Basal-body rod modification protein FlgD n=1 Tax=Noviherbaspirillum aridicola TaxID=2849687 RepID=A0ABQ4Q626_9BURK|nr:flagellar hook assembly protein FlgD [Noviherbaspirillum aridicola]GIZ52665.1 basal-body rod modification protein FlgD [Noviherbaspirillum aridicola]
MATVQGTNNNVPADLMAAMNGTKAATTSVQETQDRFMTLLITQMKNQDPLNPLDNAQVTSQMAQLSTVTGIDKLNTTLQALQASYQTSQALQATDMIGHGVLAPGSTIGLTDGQAILGADLPEAADSVRVTIMNSSGVPVRTLDLGAQKAGTLPITWDGKNDAGTQLANGSYTFEVKAVRGDTAVASTALSFGEVVSVTTNAQGVKVTIPGLGTVAFADIRQIY